MQPRRATRCLTQTLRAQLDGSMLEACPQTPKMCVFPQLIYPVGSIGHVSSLWLLCGSA